MKRKTFSGAKLKAAREKARLTQEELAKSIGLSRSAIAQYEAGTMVPLSNVLPPLAQTLRQSMAYFFAESVQSSDHDGGPSDAPIPA